MWEMPTQTDIFSNDSLSSKCTLHSWAAPSPSTTKPTSYSSALSAAHQTEGDEGERGFCFVQVCDYPNTLIRLHIQTLSSQLRAKQSRGTAVCLPPFIPTYSPWPEA